MANLSDTGAALHRNARGREARKSNISNVSFLFDTRWTGLTIRSTPLRYDNLSKEVPVLSNRMSKIRGVLPDVTPSHFITKTAPRESEWNRQNILLF